eukprot:gene9581-19912_t
MIGEVVYCISEAHTGQQSEAKEIPWAIQKSNKHSNSDIYIQKVTQESNTATNVDTDLIVDIGVIYTPQALADMGYSAAAMQSLVNLATDEANQILARSHVNLRLRVVFTLPLLNQSFVEPGGPITCTGADFVLLINHCGAYTGLGFVIYGTPGNSPTFAFANYCVNYIIGWVWLHEMGHIMGCNHNRLPDFAMVISDPTYTTYGHCWEDTNKNDCTCYRSYYECKTAPNSCTGCQVKGYLANFNVIDPIANAATGTVLASCGVHIDKYGYMPITYKKSVQTGGLIFSISPSSMLISEYGIVNITGWMMGFAGNIKSATLSGVSASILSQSIHWVVVRSPNGTTASVRAGDVIVITDLGRIVRKEWGSADGDVAELTFTNLQKASLTDSCYDTLIGMSFSYWAYPDYSYCYKEFSISTMNATSTGMWKKIWTGSTYSTSLANRPWSNITLSLPRDTRQITLIKESYCPGKAHCLFQNQGAPIVPDPTTTPTRPPSVVPTFQPSRPTVNPTLSPSVLSSFDGSTQFQYFGPLLRELSSAFTISLWIKTTTVSRIVVTYGRSATNNDGRWVMLIAETGKLLLFDYNGGYGFNYVTGSSVNGINGEFFVNGVSDGKVTASKPVTYTNTAFCIGKDYRDNTGYFKGTIGEIKSLASTASPTIPSTVMPTILPSQNPSTLPSQIPSLDLSLPPSKFPSFQLSLRPTDSPTLFPSNSPSKTPSVFTNKSQSPSPTKLPTKVPTILVETPLLVQPPTTSTKPSKKPTLDPTFRPTKNPTIEPTKRPTRIPTNKPSKKPTLDPTFRPSRIPTIAPTKRPTIIPTNKPSEKPTLDPTFRPSRIPTRHRMPSSIHCHGPYSFRPPIATFQLYPQHWITSSPSLYFPIPKFPRAAHSKPSLHRSNIKQHIMSETKPVHSS